MPGLLDNLLADDTTKDEFGQTQADRRQPLWSGLVKAGLLGVAAGGDLMPSERAKMVAQMGGAIGDIPSEMMQYRSGAAQQALRGQQVAAGKTKLANIAKLQALAKSPEFLDSIKDLKPHEKLAMQAAIDAGDIDAFTKISGQVGTSAHREQLQRIAEANLGIRERTAALREEAQAFKEQQAGTGGLKGNATENQMNNRIEDAVKRYQASGDPSVFSTTEYRSAYDWVTNDKYGEDANGQKVFIPKRNISGFAPAPGFNQKFMPELAGGQAQAVEPGATAPATGAPTWPKVPDDMRVVPGQAKKPYPLEQLPHIEKGLQMVGDLDRVIKDIDTGKVVLGPIAAAAGGIPLVGNNTLNSQNPEGIEARTLISMMASGKLKEMAGTAVTTSEFSRLEKWIPSVGDNEQTIKVKLNNFKREYDDILKSRYHNIPQGTMVPPALEARYGKKDDGGLKVGDVRKGHRYKGGDPADQNSWEKVQ